MAELIGVEFYYVGISDGQLGIFQSIMSQLEMLSISSCPADDLGKSLPPDDSQLVQLGVHTSESRDTGCIGFTLVPVKDDDIVDYKFSSQLPEPYDISSTFFGVRRFGEIGTTFRDKEVSIICYNRKEN